MHPRVERSQRHAHVGRMRGDAGFAGAEDGVDAVDAADRRAAACPARACCRASRYHRNRSSACAAGGCRRSTPCCAAAARRRPGSRLRAADSAARSADDRRGRNSAPARRSASRRPPSPRRSFSGSREMSISRDGPLDVLFHQVDQVGAAGDEFRARLGGDHAAPRRRRRCARAYWKLIMTCLHRLLDRRDDVRIGAAAADVAAHQFADLVVGFWPCLRRSARRRADLPRRAIAALERVMVDERLLQRMQRAVVGEPFDGRDLAPSFMTARVRHELIRRPSTSTVHAPHWP